MASPLDSQYAGGVARLLYQNQQAKTRLKTEGDQDSTDFQTALKRMAEAKVRTLDNTNHQSNREGLFYSGQLGKRRGDVEHQAAEQQGDAQQAFDRRTAARASALSDLGTITADGSPLGYSGTGSAAFDLGDLYNAAVDRQVQRDQSLVVPDPFGLNAPAPGAAPAAAKPPAGGLPSAFGPAAGAVWDARLGAFVKHRPDGKTEHIYPNGKRQVF